MKIRYRLLSYAKDFFKSPGVYAAMLLGATVAPLAAGHLGVLFLLVCWVVFLGQLFAWDGRIEERRKLKNNKAYRDKFMEQCNDNSNIG